MSLREFDILEERITDLLAKFETVKSENMRLKNEIAEKNDSISSLEEKVSLLAEDKKTLDNLLKDNRIKHLIENIESVIKNSDSNEKKETANDGGATDAHIETPVIKGGEGNYVANAQANIDAKPSVGNNSGNAETIKPSSPNDITNVSEDEDPFSSASDNSWDKDIEKNVSQNNSTNSIENVKHEEGKAGTEESEYEDEYLFGDEEDEFSFEEN